MSVFSISYYSINSKHITLNPDGTIEIYIPDKQQQTILDYKQSTILKEMIIAEYKLKQETKNMEP